MTDQNKYNYKLGNSAQKLFRELPSPTIQRLARRLNKLAISHGLTYTNERGKTSVINLTLRPRLIHSKIEKALWRIIYILDRAFQKIAPLYFQNPSLYELFPFSDRERNWLSCLQERDYIPGQMATRWDANTTFATQDWEEGCSFFEVNGVGVGGMWYGPAAADVALKTIIPELQKIDRQFHPVPCQNTRLLLLELILAQRRTLKRTKHAIALVMERASGSNFVEFERLAKLYRDLGHPTVVVEPTDLYLKNDELCAGGKRIDIGYRDTTLSELCLLEEKGYDLTAFRKAFRRGQIISSLEGEFDHKSVFEVFTSPQYAYAFTQKERKLFKRYILWTRLIRECRTTNSKGKLIDLIPFTLKHQANLVLKPNRLYGGQGIVFGREADRAAWRKKIEAALNQPGEWVIQQLGKLRKKSFFSPGQKKKINEKDFYVVSGFFATEKGLGIVGRMSERTVVNVARHGGLTPILLMK